MKHVTSSLEIDVEIVFCEKDEEVNNADIVLISTDDPRFPGIKMSRRDLTSNNAKKAKKIAEAIAPRNLGLNT